MIRPRRIEVLVALVGAMVLAPRSARSANPPAMSQVPAGAFSMGDTFGEGWINEVPVHAVTLDVFYIDRYGVTNEQYADALNWARDRGEIEVTSGIMKGDLGGG